MTTASTTGPRRARRRRRTARRQPRPARCSVGRRLVEPEQVVGEQAPARTDLGERSARRRRSRRPARPDRRRRRSGRRPCRRRGRARRRAAAARAPDRTAWPRSDGTPEARSGATTSGPGPIETNVSARRCSRRAKAWSASERSGSTPPTTISAIGSASTRSTRSKAATTAPSGTPSGGIAVPSRT